MRKLIDPEKKEIAFKLRLQGKSYNEILKILDLKSKGTLSYWFSNLRLTPGAKKKLEKKIKIAQDKGLLRFNKERTRRILLENKEIEEQALKGIGKLSKRELLLVGVALYWGEGMKINKNKRYAGVQLSNSAPELINLFLRFVREILLVSEDKIKAGIQVHKNVNIPRTKKFWASITRLPVDRSYITKQISSASRFRRPKRSLPFGTITIKVNSRLLAYKIRGCIKGLAS